MDMKNAKTKSPIDIYLNIVLLTLILLWSFFIVRPFGRLHITILTTSRLDCQSLRGENLTNRYLVSG